MLATDIIDVVDESFSALQRAEIAEICAPTSRRGSARQSVSVLFNEPKLLKSSSFDAGRVCVLCFSALQRAEIAEIILSLESRRQQLAVSVLFNEPKLLKFLCKNVTLIVYRTCFSALQRAEIAEILVSTYTLISRSSVSVLFNEPKLLKYLTRRLPRPCEIAFQCSSTSRNC